MTGEAGGASAGRKGGAYELGWVAVASTSLVFCAIGVDVGVVMTEVEEIASVPDRTQPVPQSKMQIAKQIDEYVESIGRSFRPALIPARTSGS